MKQKRDTIGKIAPQLESKKHENTHSAHDQMTENLSDYDKNIFECVSAGIREYNTDFYIVVITKRERLLPNVYRNYFIHRRSCPTPEHDQTVYSFNKQSGDIKLLWVVPDQQACQYLMNNAFNIPPEERALLNFVIDFAHGELYTLAKKLNNEQF